MSQLFHQPHVQGFECSQMHDVNFPPRLQCAFPSSGIFSFPLSAAMFTVDSRSPSAHVIDITDRNMDHITSLERSLCSNFFCCGVQLADFHALLEHFEENHVVVLAPNGKRVYPREGLRAVPLDPASATSTPSSSRASSVTPASPLTPQTPLSPSPSSPLSLLPGISPPASRKSSFTVPPVYTPFTPNLPVDPADPLLDSSEIVMSQEPDFDFSVQPNFFPPIAPEISSETSSSSEDEGISESSAAVHNSRAPRTPNGSDESAVERPLNVRFIASTGGEKRRDNSTSKSGKSKRHHSSGTHSKRREKMYRCPKNGCVKAYLNPNGLKYHLEKGTCKFAEDEDDPMHERTGAKRSRPTSPTAPNCGPVTDSAYQSQSAPLNTLPKIEERSRVDSMINDSDPPRVVSQPLSPVPPPVGPNRHHPVPTWDPPHIDNQRHNPYPSQVEVATTQDLKREEQEEYPPSPPVSSILSSPPQPNLPSSLDQSVPQYNTQVPQQQIQFHYPVPTYPNGYIYAQQHRSYFVTERATYETSASLLANGVAPSSS